MDDSLRLIDDLERLCLARHWADDAYNWLGDELDRGRVTATTDDVRERLLTLRDGLWVFADTLHAMTTPYPPPSLPPVTRLRIVK